jgi:hypothetical protein
MNHLVPVSAAAAGCQSVSNKKKGVDGIEREEATSSATSVFFKSTPRLVLFKRQTSTGLPCSTAQVDKSVKTITNN